MTRLLFVVIVLSLGASSVHAETLRQYFTVFQSPSYQAYTDLKITNDMDNAPSVEVPIKKVDTDILICYEAVKRCL